MRMDRAASPPLVLSSSPPPLLEVPDPSLSPPPSQALPTLSTSPPDSSSHSHSDSRSKKTRKLSRDHSFKRKKSDTPESSTPLPDVPSRKVRLGTFPSFPVKLTVFIPFLLRAPILRRFGTGLKIFLQMSGARFSQRLQQLSFRTQTQCWVLCFQENTTRSPMTTEPYASSRSSCLFRSHFLVLHTRFSLIETELISNMY